MRFEERAAILEYDGGHSRPEAERLALIEVGATPETMGEPVNRPRETAWGAKK